MDRRKAIQLMIGGAAISFVSATPAIAALRENSQSGKKHLAMLIDLRRCNGCKACVTSCGVENGNRPDEHRTQVFQAVAEQDGKQYAINLPLLCNNCEEPSCVKVCPTGATFKREQDGIIVVDATSCINCRFCAMTCPYDGSRFTNSDTGTIDKCNFCIQRTSQQLLPACVESCPGAARIFGDLSDPDSVISQLLAKHNALVIQSEKNTRPNVFYMGLTQEEASQSYSLNTDKKWQR